MKIGTTLSAASASLLGTPEVLLSSTVNTVYSLEFIARETTTGYLIFRDEAASAAEMYVDNVALTEITSIADQIDENHGVLNGVFPALGQYDPAAFNYYEFDGSSGYAKISDNAKIQNIFDDGGYAGAWAYPRSDGEGSAARIFSKTKWLIEVREESGNNVKVRLFIDFDNTDGIWTTTSAILPLNTWSHIAYTHTNNATANNPTLTITDLSGNKTEYTVGSGLTETSTPVGHTGNGCWFRLIYWKPKC